MSDRLRDPDEDDARADDFRCYGCETPMPTFRGGWCQACKDEGLGPHKDDGGEA